MLDAKLVRYIAFDMSPQRVIFAREKGLPVLFGDATRPEVLKTAGAGRAHAVVVTLDDMDAALRAVQSIRREFGDKLEIFCRARDAKYQRLLKAAGATAIVPELLEASLLLGGAVLLSYGTPADEVNSLIQESRRSNLGDLGTATRGVSEMLGSQFAAVDDGQTAAVKLVSLVSDSRVQADGAPPLGGTDVSLGASQNSRPAPSTAEAAPVDDDAPATQDVAMETQSTVARDENIYATGDDDDEDATGGDMPLAAASGG
jgi:voltage-gated potassium channel Kch